MIIVWIFVGFILGIISILLVEGFLVLMVIKKLSQRTKSADISGVNPSQYSLDSQSSLYQKQGVIWVLEPEKIPKIPVLAEQNRKNEIIEVSPIRKLAKIKDRSLILTDADGSLTKILLKGCQAVAVSATSLPTRKWAKRYPIKIESKNAVLYKGSKEIYIYAETSLEKESWCRELRLASSDDKDRLLWFSKLSEEFRSYLKSLAEGHPSLIKPSFGHHGGSVDKGSQIEDPPSKVRQFWRKLSRKNSLPSHDEKKISAKVRVVHDMSSLPGMAKTAEILNGNVEDSSSVSSGASTHSRSSAHMQEVAEADASEKYGIDEGTLCWNLLISRLFFDIKTNMDIKTALKARIQRTLSNMRTPSYIGEVTCTEINPGNMPPYINGMRAVPTDMNDLWAFEMDIEYSGGMVLYIEARLEVPELDSHSESSSVGEVPSDLLEDFKHLQKELKLTDGTTDVPDGTDSENHKDKLRSSRSTVSTSTPGSRWKAILNSVAKHVNQVPLTLAIRVASLRGTIQLHVKPPPTDQLWFGFTSMPDIQFHLESSVKDHKITSGRIASFLISRFKTSIKETLVLPNCESACIPWMLAEKDDWIPRSTAPLLWLNRESPSDGTNSNEAINSIHSKQKAGEKDLEGKQGKPKRLDSVKQPIDRGQLVSTALTRSSSDTSIRSNDLKVPLLQNGDTLDSSIQTRQVSSECHSPSRYISLKEERNGIEDDDGKPKKLGRKSRMFDLGKKMGEKIEEKRRHIEERSRHIVEKMRAP